MSARTTYASRARQALTRINPSNSEVVDLDDHTRDRDQHEDREELPVIRGRQQPRRLDPDAGRNLSREEPRYSLSHHEDRGVNVSVNNNGTYFRSVRDELTLSAYRSAGNFLAWPFRLVGRLFEGIANAVMGLLGFILKILIIPTVLFLGISIYQASEGRTAGETAQVVGKESIGVIGGLLSGIWEGIFGSDDEAAETAEPAE